MLIVNLFGGPGCGKSTTAAGLFYKLKKSGISTELVNEYAKEKVWEGHINILEDQLYVFAKQLRKIRRLDGKVDVVVSDSPILLCAYYLKYNKHPIEFLRGMVVSQHNQMENLNIFLERTKPYNPSGRLGSEESSRAKDLEIKAMLESEKQSFITLIDNDETVSKIYEEVTCLL